MKLQDVCELFTDGDWIESKDQSDKGIRLVQTGNIGIGKYLKKEGREKYISQETFEKLNCTEIYPGDILISRLPEPVGRGCIIPETNERMITAVDCTICRINDNLIDKKYFCYYLQSPFYHNQLFKSVTGTTRKRISRKNLGDVEINIPDRARQLEIVRILDNVMMIIDSRKQQLQQLDDLVKARFVEMFGDYDLSHIQSNWKMIADIGKVVGGATPKTNIDEYWGGEYRWITPAELSADSGYIYDSIRKLTKIGVDSCSLQEMPVDTVILTSRAPIGKVAIAGKTFYCNQGFKNIVCGKEVLPRYLYTVLLLNTEYLNSLGRGATFKEISKSIVENIRVPVPPMELQEQFTAFIEQVDKSKFAVQKALDEAQTLFDSLMQEYFG